MNEDEKNYQAFLAGELEGFENLVLSYKENLIYFIQRYVHDLYQAEDLAQDVFVEIYVHKERYRFQSSFKTYLFTIGRNKAIDYIRKQQRSMLVDEVSPELSYDQELLEKVIGNEKNEYLLKAIHKLKPDYQKIIHLIIIEEQSYKEACEILHKTMPQIKVLVHRAKKSLKKVLEKDGIMNEI